VPWLRFRRKKDAAKRPAKKQKASRAVREKRFPEDDLRLPLRALPVRMLLPLLRPLLPSPALLLSLLGIVRVVLGKDHRRQRRPVVLNNASIARKPGHDQFSSREACPPAPPCPARRSGVKALVASRHGSHEKDPPARLF
jgi:hypothetical protein